MPATASLCRLPLYPTDAQQEGWRLLFRSERRKRSGRLTTTYRGGFVVPMHANLSPASSFFFGTSSSSSPSLSYATLFLAQKTQKPTKSAHGSCSHACACTRKVSVGSAVPRLSLGRWQTKGGSPDDRITPGDAANSPAGFLTSWPGRKRTCTLAHRKIATRTAPWRKYFSQTVSRYTRMRARYGGGCVPHAVTPDKYTRDLAPLYSLEKPAPGPSRTKRLLMG